MLGNSTTGGAFFARAGIRGALSAVVVVAMLAGTSGTARAQPPEEDPQTEQAPAPRYSEPRTMPGGVAMSGPRTITDYEDGDPIPRGYHPVTRARKGLIIGGAVTFGVMYLFSVLIGAAANDVSTATGGSSNPDSALFIPGLGPFIQMGHGNLATENVLLAIDGAAQTAGLAMFIYGLASPKTVLMRDDLGHLDTKPTLRATPMVVGRGGAGFGVIGTF